MDIAIVSVFILGFLAGEIFLLYFFLERYVRPSRVGVLIRSLWTLFFLSVGVYLMFFSPSTIRGRFSPGANIGFIIFIGIVIILLLVIWLTMPRNGSK